MKFCPNPGKLKPRKQLQSMLISTQRLLLCLWYMFLGQQIQTYLTCALHVWLRKKTLYRDWPCMTVLHFVQQNGEKVNLQSWIIHLLELFARHDCVTEYWIVYLLTTQSFEWNFSLNFLLWVSSSCSDFFVLSIPLFYWPLWLKRKHHHHFAFISLHFPAVSSSPLCFSIWNH